MPKLILMPPQNSESRQWAERIRNELPVYTVVLPETDEAVAEHLPDAEAVCGWVSPEQLPLAKICDGSKTPQRVPSPATIILN